MILLSSVLIRYLIKGPESERLQPSLSLIHHENRIDANFVNFDFQQNIDPLMAGIVQKLLARPTKTGTTKALQQKPSNLLSPPSPPTGQSAADQSATG